MLIAFSVLTFLSIVVGGFVGFKYKDKTHLVLGFTAGVLLGIVAFDILPEIVEMTEMLSVDIMTPMIALVTGFLIFHIFEKVILVHHSHEEHYGEHKHPAVGVASALAISGHAFLDGVGIGLGFQISDAVGIAIATAVIAHGFSDGLNTVSLALMHENSSGKSLKLLGLNAIAPAAGVLFSRLIAIPQEFLLVYLGLFAGFLLYIGASEILPEAHSGKSSYKTIGMTITGVVFMYVLTRLA